MDARTTVGRETSLKFTCFRPQKRPETPKPARILLFLLHCLRDKLDQPGKFACFVVL